MINDIINIFKELKELEDKINAGQTEYASEYTQIYDDLCEIISRMQKRLPERMHYFYDNTLVYEAFKIIYLLDKYGAPVLGRR